MGGKKPILFRKSKPLPAGAASGSASARPSSSNPPEPHASRLTPHEPACRINKFFTQQGIGSRREADQWIEAGRVTINGRVAKLGDRVVPGDTVARDGRVIPWGNRSVYIKFHKPLGVTTTCELD